MSCMWTRNVHICPVSSHHEAYRVIQSDLDSRFFSLHGSDFDPCTARPAVICEAGDGSNSICRDLEAPRQILCIYEVYLPVGLRGAPAPSCAPPEFPARTNRCSSKMTTLTFPLTWQGRFVMLRTCRGGRDPVGASRGAAFRHEDKAFREIRRAGRHLWIGEERNPAFAPLARV